MKNTDIAKNNFEKNPPSTTQWDTLGQEVPFNQKQISTKQPSNIPLSRQQRKLIGVLLSNNTDIIDQPNCSINEQQYANIINQIKNKSITTTDFKRIISQIQGPQTSKSPRQILVNLGNKKHERRILATMSGLGFDNYNQLQPSQIQNFYALFPEPADFDKQADSFLADIKSHNSPQKYKEYLQAMDNFKHTLYGKKQEYWDQAKALLKSNREQPEKLSPEHILKLTKIDGSPVNINGQELRLAPDILKQMNLGPHHEVSIENTKINFSDTFKIGNRDAVIGYVPTPDGRFKARSYYRSNSAGVWRYLPDYVTKEAGTSVWYGKAYGEESLTLPFELQKALNSIAKSGPIDTGNINPRFAFLGTAQRYSEEQYDAYKKIGALRGDYYKEVRPNPTYNFGTLSQEKAPPELLDIPNANAPNFYKELNSYHSNATLYGTIKTRLFQSFNQKLRYIMCETRSRNNEINAWIGSIETNAPITSTGLRSDWVFAGDIGTPLYEYGSMTDGYGSTTDTKGRYQNMWQKYLKHIPLIRRYVSSLSSKS